MGKRVGLVLVALAIAIFLFLQFRSRNEEKSESVPLPPAPEGTTSADGEHSAAIRHPAEHPSPRQEYLKALEKEDEMKRLPTWEEMRADTPAEF